MPVRIHLWVVVCITDAWMWFFKSFTIVILVSSFHNNASLPPFLSQSTPRQPLKPTRIFILSMFLVIGSISCKNKISGSSYLTSLLRARISCEFPSPHMFQHMIFIALGGVDLQPPLFHLYCVPSHKVLWMKILWKCEPMPLFCSSLFCMKTRWVHPPLEGEFILL